MNNKYEFIGMLVLFAIPTAVSLMALIKPIMQLNANIAVLSENIRSLRVDHDKQGDRIKKHGEEIDEVRTNQIRILQRLEAVERRVDRIDG